ncbi:hypothetical protein QJS04_geneDACA005722 [Acorus gramineus]|uniref:Uncharacterized protein n=1 Tax=Acorus gramineus TaxID=55184 RepID=A0AAV9BEF1_ACOGR|nr:hypothetical protein QJS04_geneDACA005722 [Acorus gramineus]
MRRRLGGSALNTDIEVRRSLEKELMKVLWGGFCRTIDGPLHGRLNRRRSRCAKKRDERRRPR